MEADLTRFIEDKVGKNQTSQDLCKMLDVTMLCNMELAKITCEMHNNQPWIKTFVIVNPNYEGFFSNHEE